jgi:glycine cleavage system aminomethyltransferase T
MEDNIDSHGVARYPVGICPILDPATGEGLVDSLGRRSFTTSMAYGPTIGKNIALGYLPHEWAQEGLKLEIEYFGERYPMVVAGVGYKPLYDPQNLKPRS